MRPESREHHPTGWEDVTTDHNRWKLFIKAHIQIGEKRREDVQRDRKQTIEAITPAGSVTETVTQDLHASSA